MHGYRTTGFRNIHWIRVGIIIIRYRVGINMLEQIIGINVPKYRVDINIPAGTGYSDKYTWDRL
jgi:hypothetical protein